MLKEENKIQFNLDFDIDFLRKLQNLYLRYKGKKREQLHISDKWYHEVLCTCNTQMASGISGNEMQRSRFLFPFSLYYLVLQQYLADGFHIPGMIAYSCQKLIVVYILQELMERGEGKDKLFRDHTRDQHLCDKRSSELSVHLSYLIPSTKFL